MKRSRAGPRHAAKARGVISVSSKSGGLHRIGVSPERIAVLPNGVSPILSRIRGTAPYPGRSSIRSMNWR